MNVKISDRLKELMENEMRSCSMDLGCITPTYIFRILGGSVPLYEIEAALPDEQKQLLFGA